MKRISTVKLIVTGQVQGVGFRWATLKAAQKINVTGFVTNLYNGNVKIIAQGPTGPLKRFINVIKRSPTPYGHVNQVQIQRIQLERYPNFSIQ